MLRVKEEELSLRERRENSHHRRRRYSEDYDSEAELFQQYRAAGLAAHMVSPAPLRLGRTCSFRSQGSHSIGALHPRRRGGATTRTTSRLSVPS